MRQIEGSARLTTARSLIRMSMTSVRHADVLRNTIELQVFVNVHYIILCGAHIAQHIADYGREVRVQARIISAIGKESHVVYA